MKIWISTNRKQLMEFLKCVCLLCNSHACQTAENPGNPKTNKAFRHARGVADINQMATPFSSSHINTPGNKQHLHYKQHLPNYTTH